MTALLREGDLVGLTGKVRYDSRPDDDSGRVFVEVKGHHSPLWLKYEHVTLIAPRIDVGERVRWTNGSEGKVLARDVDKLWVKLDDGSYVIWPAKEVTVIAPQAADPDPVEPPPAPLAGEVGSDVAEEEQQREAEAEETRRLENEEMEKHFEKHPHG